MLCVREDIEELLKKYPDPREAEAGRAGVRKREEIRTTLACFAVVADNRDPGGLGRIRAACDMLAPGALTDWIPLAGTGRGNPGSGFWLIPDIGTQVILVFPWADTGRPVALGCVFDHTHPPPKASTEKPPDCHVWQTKNHRVEIREDEGKESLSISTANGEMRYTARAAGGIEIINELGDIAISCKKLRITAKSNLSLLARKNLSLRSGGNLSAKSAQNTALCCGKGLTLRGGQIKLSGSGGVCACGKQMAKSGDAVMGFDIHLTEIPSGSGTSTVRLPHPFIGKLTKGLSSNVKIGGKGAAVLGSVGTHDDGGHNRLAGTLRFTGNPKNEGAVSSGVAQTVTINSKAAALIGSTMSTCNDAGQKDHSIVIAQGTSFPMPAIINPANTEHYERERAEREKTRPCFTQALFLPSSAAEGEDFRLLAQVKDIAAGNTVTFQVWQDGQDPASHVPCAVIPAEIQGASAEAKWVRRYAEDTPPPEKDPRFFFTVHSPWCAPLQSPAVTLRLARPRLARPEWNDGRGNTLTRGIAGTPLGLRVRCEEMREDAAVIFRVYDAGGARQEPLAEIPSRQNGGKAQARWLWRENSSEPLTRKPRIFFTAQGPRGCEARSAEVEIAARIYLRLISPDNMCIPRAKGVLFRTGERRDIEITEGFFEDPDCVPGDWRFRLSEIPGEEEAAEEFEAGQESYRAFRISLERLKTEGIRLPAGEEKILIIIQQEKGYSL
jgi:phage baseplate assembly protein gpV